MGAQTKCGYRLTQDCYAQVYGVHPNTIHRWQKRRLPLDAPRNMLFVLAHHPACPAAVRWKGMVAILADYERFSNVLGAG